MPALALVGRVLYAAIFIVAGPRHFTSAAIASAADHGVPLARILVPASGLLAMVAGLSIAFGYHARWGAIGVIAFLIPVTVAMHDFWAVSDPELARLQVAMFMKNIALIGAALVLSSPRPSP